MSLETGFLISRIKALSPQARRAKLKEILDAMPDDWLYEADTVLHIVLETRQAANNAYRRQVEHEIGLVKWVQ